VDLTPEQVKAYNEMKALAMAQINGGLVSTVNALTQLMRLHQIVCGHVKLDDGTIIELPNKRMDELLAVVEETDGKIIIWANYRHDIEAIKAGLGQGIRHEQRGTYYGDTDVRGAPARARRLPKPRTARCASLWATRARAATA
jgi:hypothetical protein